MIEKYDVIVIPDDSTAMITGAAAPAAAGGRGGGGGEGVNFPPECRAGVGNEGIAALKEFVNKGGTLVALRGASDFAIEQFSLGLWNSLAGLNTKDFWCPGSTLRLETTRSPLPMECRCARLACSCKATWRSICRTRRMRIIT
jgi:hypothetical protein